MYEYKAQVTKVVDGDTVHARVDLGCDVRLDMTIRLYGIDAPELPTVAGIAAKEWLIEKLAFTDGHVTLRTVKDRREKYGRYLGVLEQGAESLNDAMVEAGLARVYLP